jgi:hypothetical protein
MCVAVDRKDFGEEVSRVDETRDKDKAEEVLACPLLKLILTHVDQLGLLRSHRRSRKADRTPKKSQGRSHIRGRRRGGG